MCAAVHAPPFMLGERPTPTHGGFGTLSFRQVPFVRVSERVENGVKVRKQLRKYLKQSSHTQQMVAQMHLTDACIKMMQPAEFSQSCFQKFFDQMKMYNEKIGQKHLEASKAFLEMTLPLQNSNKSKKWAKDVYNLVQKCVQDVTYAEKKMEKARQRKTKAIEELHHWKKVFEANEATYLVQPNNPDVLRGYQLAQTRFNYSIQEEETAILEYEESKNLLYASIERRDEVVEEATEFSQSIEEDRLDTMLIVFKQFVETKVNILQAEIEAMNHMQKLVKEMERESVIQQYIVDHMEPTLTHRHAKALSLLEWHLHWHQEQENATKNEPTSFLHLTEEDLQKLKGTGITPNDIEIIKDFITTCFIDPQESSKTSSASSCSQKHRNRFTDSKMAMTMYRMEIVRKIILECLNHQRTHSQELSDEGFDVLSMALRLVLNASKEKSDTKCIKNLMNMSQTFYRILKHTDGSTEDQKLYLQASFKDHPVWLVPEYWGNALLLTIGEELSKMPQQVAWYHLTSHDRTQKVLHVHNLVFGQVTSFLLNMSAFGVTKNQIFQFVSNVCFAYELSEDQRIALLASVEALKGSKKSKKLHHHYKEEQDDTKGFTAMTLPDWTIQYDTFASPHIRMRSSSTSSTTSNNSLTSTIASRFRTFSSNKSLGGGATGANIEASMRSTASNMSTASTAAGESTLQEESWEDLFGGGDGADGGENSEPKLIKVSSRNQLRKARSRPLSFRMDSSSSFTSTASEPPDPEPPVQAVEATSPTKKEKKKNKRTVKAKSATMIDTSCLSPDNFFHSTSNSQPIVAPSATAAAAAVSATCPVPSTQQDAILAAAAAMSRRRQEASGSETNTSEGETGILRRTQSAMSMNNDGNIDSNKSLPPRSPPLKPSKNQSARSLEKEKQLSGVAALRARFEKDF